MRMLVAALIAGVLIGFIAAKVLGPEILKLVTNPTLQPFAVAGVAAFLGSLWGWVGKGVLDSKGKE